VFEREGAFVFELGAGKGRKAFASEGAKE
jgi:hypothetical protein